MTRCRAVAIDLDGTIAFKDSRVDPVCIEPLRSLVREVPVIIATGNTVCYAMTAAILIGVDRTVIAENGGVIKVGRDGVEIVNGNGEECRRAYEILKDEMKLEALDWDLRKSDVALRRNVSIDQLSRRLAEINPLLEVVDSGLALHIKDRRINKGEALKVVSDIIEVDLTDFAAIGDSDNDIEMLEEVGIGIAVGNASDRLKAVADVVVEGEYGKGVVEAIEILRG
ncbi:MAG TPA: phosphoglycolate phosphatase [Candidatus Syntrophoarchaeum butanivorans]|uniref:Phosphoglycolate phosphatase n=1 Tax=Candidatus Syntropharchaeum butanivorans TaxID=1839936 RepID=A0A1F2P572_9EURY|nr:MAG: phosphoglycolate phosphatase [Candidatus Syntrophoarchaeum butanivorans]HEC57887.1 phosphoglycolate phosphatase [Candidatus Syntrophoarchaeum butanivorans]